MAVAVKSDATLFPRNKNDVKIRTKPKFCKIQQTIVGDTNFIISFLLKKI